MLLHARWGAGFAGGGPVNLKKDFRAAGMSFGQDAANISISQHAKAYNNLHLKV